MLILVVVVILKCLSLWFAARYEKKPYWFIALLIFSTLGLLPLVYLIFFRKKKKKVIKMERIFKDETLDKLKNLAFIIIIVWIILTLMRVI